MRKKIQKMSESLISSFLVSDMSESLISPNQMSDVSKSLISLTKIERLWVIRSGCSKEMRDCERIAQVAYPKWAIRSEIKWAKSQPCPLPYHMRPIT